MMKHSVVHAVVGLLLLICCMAASSALADLDVYYLDVGQADSTLLVCDGHALLIDGGNTDDAEKIVTMITDRIGTHALDAVIATHPHEDHIGGLKAVLNTFMVGTLYSPVTEYDGYHFVVMVDAADAQGLSITVPTVGESFSFGDAEVTFLSPGHEYPDTNNMSIAVRVTYGSTAFVFTGDAEQLAEDDMVASGMNLSADVLHIGHHGSATSTTVEFLSSVYPSYGVISVSSNNGYGHPVQDTMDMLLYYGIMVYRTDMEGDIYCHSDGESISFLTERDIEDDALLYQAYAEVELPSDIVYAYVGNANTMRLHLPECKSVSEMKEKNRMFFETREEAIDLGFIPCGRCHP